ncbi:MAG: hypothetical protein E6Q57_19775 [Mycobacterium sp.]|nr:MAG: hypothetical protein E6Q57_19775 [Mycobacterium sp.]
MSTSLRRSVLLIGAALLATSLSDAPAATAEPAPVLPGSGPADLIVNELQALGYTVSINWTNGQDSSPPLSGCRVISFHNPDRSGTSAPQGTTVYVDVLCPNESED